MANYFVPDVEAQKHVVVVVSNEHRYKSVESGQNNLRMQATYNVFRRGELRSEWVREMDRIVPLLSWISPFLSLIKSSRRYCKISDHTSRSVMALEFGGHEESVWSRCECVGITSRSCLHRLATGVAIT